MSGGAGGREATRTFGRMRGPKALSQSASPAQMIEITHLKNQRCELSFFLFYTRSAGGTEALQV
jgi:hypothetical protein